jgi:signal transduction histidine kinase
VLQVSDTGPGLSDETAARAFTRGWSTKTDQRPAGHGLGLALVGQTARRNNGTVEVRGTGDAPYPGAVFTVRLPVAVEVAR